MRSFILGAVLCLVGIVAGANSASAQVVTYSTPYGGFSYTAAYPGAVVYPTVPAAPYVVRRPFGYVAPYAAVTPWYPRTYYYNRPYYGTYYPYYWRY